MDLPNEHVYNIAPPHSGKVHVTPNKAGPNQRPSEHPPGLDIEAGGRHKIVPFTTHNPDPMTLPRDHYVTLMSGDNVFSVTAGQLQDLDKKHPKQPVFAKAAEAFANDPEKFNLGNFEKALAASDKAAGKEGGKEVVFSRRVGIPGVVEKEVTLTREQAGVIVEEAAKGGKVLLKKGRDLLDKWKPHSEPKPEGSKLQSSENTLGLPPEVVAGAIAGAVVAVATNKGVMGLAVKAFEKWQEHNPSDNPITYTVCGSFPQAPKHVESARPVARNTGMGSHS